MKLMILAVWVTMAMTGSGADLAPGVGRQWGVERSSYRDPVTGLRIVEITAAGVPADNLYYHFSNFTADNRYLIFQSKRTGTPQIYRYEAESGAIVQLTNDPEVAAATACPDPTEASRVYFMRGSELRALHVETFEQRVVGVVPGPGMGGYSQPSVSGDGKWVTVTKRPDERTWEIGVIAAGTGEYRTVLRQGFRIGHVQHSPVSDSIFYVWETGGYAPQRSWVVRRDGTGNRPLYAPTDSKEWLTPQKEWLTHEAWVAGTGEMTMVNDKVGVMVVREDGTARLVREGRYWHASARADGKYLALDDAQGRVWLAETATGNVRLLATGYRDAVRAVHGHLSFDRKGRFVQFHTGRRHETVALIDLTQELGKEVYDLGR
ncbi:MAG: PD40 domain-containing protein [Bryobacterales bacterium]|nr:PD40 domain-containing protein [Bryobacterales bacterium]